MKRELAGSTTFEDLRNSYLRYEAYWRRLADEAEEQSAPDSFWQSLRRLVSKLRH